MVSIKKPYSDLKAAMNPLPFDQAMAFSLVIHNEGIRASHLRNQF